MQCKRVARHGVGRPVSCIAGLFIGVTFYHFSQLKAASDLGSSDLTDKQREWIQMIGVVEDTEPLVRGSGCSAGGFCPTMEIKRVLTDQSSSV